LVSISCLMVPVVFPTESVRLTSSLKASWVSRQKLVMDTRMKKRETKAIIWNR